MTTTSTLYVGIDISLDTNQVCVMNFDQHRFFNRSFENSSTGSDTLIREIVSIMNHRDFSHLVITMEATSVYFFHIANKLSNAEELKLFDT